MPVALLIDPATGLIALHGWSGTAWVPVSVDAAGHLQLDILSWTAAAHHTTHENGGADKVNVGGLSGELADDQPSTFLKLSDTPAGYAGCGGQAVAVKSTVDGLEFVEFPSAGLAELGEAIAGTDTQQLDVSGLDLLTSRFFWIVFYVRNVVVSAGKYYLYVNDDVTATNYYSQLMIATGTSVGAARSNDALVLDVVASSGGSCRGAMMRDPGGYLRGNFAGQDGVGVLVRMLDYGWTKTATVENVTKVSIKASAATGIGAGSHLIVFGTV